MRSDVAEKQEGRDGRSRTKEACRGNKICQETVMKTKRRVWCFQWK